MQTLHPDTFIIQDLPDEFNNKNAPLYQGGRHKMVSQSLDLFFEDFNSYVLIFELFKTIQRDKPKHLL